MLKAELPGIEREDIDIRVENNLLTIRGERKRDQETQAGGLSPRRAGLRRLQPFVLAAVDGQHREGERRVQGRRADRSRCRLATKPSRARFRSRSTDQPRVSRAESDGALHERGPELAALRAYALAPGPVDGAGSTVARAPGDASGLPIATLRNSSRCAPPVTAGERPPSLVEQRRRSHECASPS